jgi:hypothetical protein
MADDGKADEKGHSTPDLARQTGGKNLEDTSEWHKCRQEKKYSKNNNQLKNDIWHNFERIGFPFANKMQKSTVSMAFWPHFSISLSRRRCLSGNKIGAKSYIFSACAHLPHGLMLRLDDWC